MAFSYNSAAVCHKRSSLHERYKIEGQGDLAEESLTGHHIVIYYIFSLDPTVSEHCQEEVFILGRFRLAPPCNIDIFYRYFIALIKAHKKV